jgi:methyl-accepting chemotaxis protein
MIKDNNNLDFLDMLNILSFAIGILNYGENVSQGDMQELAQTVSQHTSEAVEDLHQHLQEQDRQIEEIYGKLNEIFNILKENIANANKTLRTQ